MNDRLEKLRTFMAAEKVDSMYVTNRSSIRYLSGFSGSAALLLISEKDAHFFTDFRYKEQSAQEVSSEFEIHIGKKLLEESTAFIGNAKRVGFESRYTTYSFYEELKKLLDDRELVPLSDYIMELRSRKTPEEIEKIERAQKITDAVFSEVLEIINPEMTELELAAEIEYRMKRHGAEGFAFSTIVASGPHSALPHAKPRPVKLGTETMVVMDFGARLDGYNSDMTRTIWIGNSPDPKFLEIYEITLKAQTLAEERARIGMKASDLDGIARNYIKEHGYGEQFGHGLGHGVGIDVHELPRVAESSEEILNENTVFTVEPGIYLPGFGGVRIEDMVVLQKDGPRILTASSKELIKV